MRTRRSLRLVALASLACCVWLGCNAILGNESAEFDPEAAARLDSGNDGTTPGDGTTTTDGSGDGEGDGSLDGDFDGGPCFGVDLDGSSTNCGSCGHSCLGGACTGGRCQPFVLATDVKGPSVLVRNGDFLYWVNNKTGDIKRVHVDGGAVQLMFDGPTDTAGDSIAFGANDFYYPVTTVDGGIIACPKATGCTGTPFLIANVDVPGSVFVAGNELYYAETQFGGRVAHCTLPCASAPTDVTPPEGLPAHIAVEGTGVYWSAILPSPGIRGKEGADSVRTVSAQAPVGEIVVLANEIWWTELGDGPRVAPRDGGAPRRLRVGAAGMQSQNIHVTNDSVYFTDPQPGTVWKCPRAGCPDAAAPLFTSAGSTPHGISADNGAIYWADEGSTDAGGAIYRLAQ